jgi:cytochrome P450
MTTDDVIGECKMFYFAGAETTSVLLTWTMIVLCMHPEWQDRVREEVMLVFGASTPDYDSLSRLKIVSCSAIFCHRKKIIDLMQGNAAS